MHNVSAHEAKAGFDQLLDTARRELVVIECHGLRWTPTVGQLGTENKLRTESSS